MKASTYWIITGLASGVAIGLVADQAIDTDRARAEVTYRQCAAGYVLVRGMTQSGTVCVPGYVVAGDRLQ